VDLSGRSTWFFYVCGREWAGGAKETCEGRRKEEGRERGSRRRRRRRRRRPMLSPQQFLTSTRLPPRAPSARTMHWSGPGGSISPASASWSTCLRARDMGETTTEKRANRASKKEEGSQNFVTFFYQLFENSLGFLLLLLLTPGPPARPPRSPPRSPGSASASPGASRPPPSRPRPSPPPAPSSLPRL